MATFKPMYGGKTGGKMNNGAGFGGEPPAKKKSTKVHRTTAKAAANKLGY